MYYLSWFKCGYITQVFLKLSHITEESIWPTLWAQDSRKADIEDCALVHEYVSDRVWTDTKH